MKTLRLLVAVGLLIGSYTVGMAQSNGGSAEKVEVKQEARFASDADKAAWIKANPEKYAAEKAESKSTRNYTKTSTTSTATVRTKSAKPASTAVVLPANTVKSTTVIEGAASSGKKVEVKRVNNTVKALPADYKAPSNETKPNK